MRKKLKNIFPSLPRPLPLFWSRGRDPGSPDGLLLKGLNPLRATAQHAESILGAKSTPPDPRPQAAPGHAEHSGFWGLLTSAPWELPFLFPAQAHSAMLTREQGPCGPTCRAAGAAPKGLLVPSPQLPGLQRAPTGRLTPSPSFLPVHSTRNTATRAQKAEF